MTPDLSSNSLGRSYILARMLQERFEVEIVGPMFGGGPWGPLADRTDFYWKGLKMEKNLGSLRRLKEVAQLAKGEVVYVSKPLLFSFLPGLMVKLREKKPLVVDVDDWEWGFILGSLKRRLLQRKDSYRVGVPKGGERKTLPLDLLRVASVPILERLLFLADAVTVSNQFLRRKFGGTVIYHARDTRWMDPARFSGDNMRKELNISPSQRVVMFLGSPAPYKGVEELIEAVSRLGRGDLCLVLVGLEEREGYCNYLKWLGEEKLKSRFVNIGIQPFQRIAELIAMADVMVVPQKKTIETRGQLPAKVFDAMAMAKPLVVTDVSDLSEIVNGWGWVVEPGRPDALAGALQDIFNNYAEAQERGKKARERCVERYSYEAVGRILCDLFTQFNVISPDQRGSE